MTKKKLAFRQAAAIILAIFLMVQAGSFVFAAGAPSTWAQAEVDEARTKGLILSSADGNYQENITRVLFCMQIVNMVETVLGTPVAVTITNPFQDISNEYVTKAYQLGIVNGISATEFAPLNFITRQEIAAMMMRSARVLDQLAGKSYADVTGTESLVFADQDAIASWALADIRIANSLDIMKGVGDNKINPTGNTTVEQSILLVNRLCDGFSAAPVDSADPVTPVNHAPSALSNPVVFSTAEQTAQLIDASQLASDSDGDTLEVVAINGQTAVYTTTYGSAELTSTGEISYISGDITANVIDDFIVTVSDGTALTHINIRINLTASLNFIFTPTLSTASILGDPLLGETISLYLISYLGTVPSTSPTFSYQWKSSAAAGGTYTNISGAVSSSYQITSRDVGKYLKLEVTASGSAGGSATSAAIGPVTSGFDGGSGTSTDPFQITTAEQFMQLNTVPTLNQYFKLTSSFSLDEDDYITSTFDGTLYGYGNTVTLDISGATTAYIGLFKTTGSSAYITTVNVSGSIDTTYSCAAGIAGRNDGTIYKCFSDITINTTNDYAAGIAAFNVGIISKCSSMAVVEADENAGAIVAYNNGTVSRCTVASGSVTANRLAGGVVGRNSTSASVIYCLSSDPVSANSYGGGLVGYNEGNIVDSYSAGSVIGTSAIGGLVGYNDGGNISRSYYDKNTSGQSDTGKGTPKTTTEMKTQSTFEDWNFAEIWNISVGNYPFLR